MCPSKNRSAARAARYRGLTFSVALVVIGLGWLITEAAVVREVNWLWVSCLALTGLLPLVTWGLDKATLVLASVGLAAAVSSVLRQLGVIDVGIQMPSLVIWTGFTLIVAQLAPLRHPAWLISIRSSDGLGGGDGSGGDSADGA